MRRVKSKMRIAFIIAYIVACATQPPLRTMRNGDLVFVCMTEREAMATAFYEGYSQGWSQSDKKPQDSFAWWYGMFQKCIAHGAQSKKGK